MGERVKSIRVFYPSGRDLRAWRDRHSRGEGPDAWPYGLDRLEPHFDHVTAEQLPQDSLVRRATRRLLQPTPPAWLRGRGATGITWDENTLSRLAFVPGLQSRYSGIVWLTDQLERRDAKSLQRVREHLHRMDGLWVLSSAQVEPLQQFVGADGPRVEHLLFGVDTDFFREQPPATSPTIVSVGGDRDRDAETLFAALARVRAAAPDVRIVVQSKAQAAPPPGVTVLPRLTHAELRDLYGQASLVMVATRPNSHVSGMTVGLEAMATGRPLIITGSPGMSDYFSGTEGARMVETRSPDQLADAALTLLSDAEGLRRAQSEAARHARANYTTTDMAKRLAAILRE